MPNESDNTISVIDVSRRPYTLKSEFDVPARTHMRGGIGCRYVVRQLGFSRAALLLVSFELNQVRIEVEFFAHLGLG